MATNAPLTRSASGLLLQNGSGWVTAVNSLGNRRWQQKVYAGMASNITGSDADFVSILKSVSPGSVAGSEKVELLITGFSVQGETLWQRTERRDASTGSKWSFANDNNGRACYVADSDAGQYLSCLGANGAPQFKIPVTDSNVHTLRISNDRVFLASENSDGVTSQFDLYDRQGTLLQENSNSFGGHHELLDAAFTTDDNVHATYSSFPGNDVQLSLVTLNGSGDMALRTLSQRTLEAIPVYSWQTVGEMSVDESGNLYVISEQATTVSKDEKSYKTLQSVIVKLDSTGKLTTPVVGQLSKYNYSEKGECYRRCLTIPSAMMLTDIAALSNGRLMTTWASVEYAAQAGDSGTQLTPTRRSLIVSSYLPSATPAP